MISSKNIAAKVSLILNDMGFVSWKIPDLAKWINAATRELVLLKPSALTATVAMLLSAGTKQSLAGAAFVNTLDGSAAAVVPLQLLEVVRNMGDSGTETQAGAAVVGQQRKVLDVMLPGWHKSPSGGEVLYFMFDAKDPKSFYIYPQASADPAMYADVVISRAPVNSLLDTATAFADDDIDAGLDDIWESALVDYVLYRAFLRDSENPSYATRAQAHYRAFATALGVKLQNEFAQSPTRQFKSPAPAPSEGV